MIVDHISNAGLYKPMHARLAKAFDWLVAQDFEAMPEGKHIVDGTEIFAIVQKYKTKPMDESGYWEAHQSYLDLQYVVKGREDFGYGYLPQFSVKTPYDTEKDKVVLNGKGSFVTLDEKMFAVVFPQDVHWPARAFADTLSTDVLKVVVKVLI